MTISPANHSKRFGLRAVVFGFALAITTGAFAWMQLREPTSSPDAELELLFRPLPPADRIAFLREYYLFTAWRECGVNFDKSEFEQAFFTALQPDMNATDAAMRSWMRARPANRIPTEFVRAALSPESDPLPEMIIDRFGWGADYVSSNVELRADRTFVHDHADCLSRFQATGTWALAGAELTLHGADSRILMQFRVVVWRDRPYLVSLEKFAELSTRKPSGIGVYRQRLRQPAHLPAFSF
jgi:hypothetical protein